ncbi:MAG: NAD-dependent succinate-semialdehyde dehydrogenase [Alphaproteobacteria bacterium]|nr:NAD-dependent succinate-semialdehyde dehydrogenase [Alphaproteobacteria bacterium]MBU0875876.1 NAD-dependent succinate-semialdehyde dehydrogenase [Alphaproteobacteria bacterium]MBU1769943.1 NAD-dependent succinate-semialdehyde dehydrogenase [Alphaproteobacteria bacterium]
MTEMFRAGDSDKLIVRNPATGETIATVRAYRPAEVAPLIEQAETARLDWAGRTAKERALLLRRWFDLVILRQEDMAQLITAESGKPLAEARGEVTYGAAFIEWFAEEGKRAYGETIPTFAPGKRVMTIRQPVGTCAAITPWNFPVAMITRKVAPALAAGCSIIVKPAEATPLSALFLEELAQEAGIPAAVFRVVPTTDPAAMGSLFCRHPLIRKLSFTGSTRVGKLLMAQAAGQVKRVSMELGGNAPFIVFDDADLDAAVEGVLASKFRNAGQTCVCANRILVQAGVYDDFVRRLSVAVNALPVGDGADPVTKIGPLINSDALDKVVRLVTGAQQAGARMETQAPALPATGHFHAPTVLSGVTQDMEIARSEIFGPVAPVIRFSNEAEGIRLANDTPYGLAAYLYARDVGRIWRAMEALEYGMVAVNDGILSTEVAPFGGIKESGVGREGSRHGLDEYLNIKYCMLGGINR